MEEQNKILISRICTAILIFILIIIIILISRGNSGYEKILLDNGWKVTKNGVTNNYQNIVTDGINMSQKGDRVVLSIDLRDKVHNPMIVFRTYHVAVKVFLENKCIYKYGQELFDEEKEIGCGYHYIKLPENYFGEKLTISIETNERNAFSYLEKIYLVDSATYTSGYIKENFGGIISSLIMMSVGIIVIFTVLIVGTNKKRYQKILYIGLASFLLGTWIQCYLGYIRLFTSNFVLTSYLEHLCLLSLPIPIMMFYYESVKEGILKKIIGAGVLSNVVFVAICFILDQTGIVHLNCDISVFHTLSIVYMVIILCSVFSGCMENQKARLSMQIGIVCLAASLVIELVTYTINKINKSQEITFSFVCVGGFAYITSMLISYMFYIVEGIDRQAEEDALKKLAYMDTLTGVANRKLCESKLKELDKKNAKSFAIVNFDLNWLKKINDGMGHIYGDKYLCEFSDLLNEYSGDNVTVGRMGGDEFIAIMENYNEQDVEKFIKNINEKSGNGNKPETRQMGQGVSFAYGWGVSTEQKPITTHKAFEIADKMMYECKKEQKVGRK